MEGRLGATQNKDGFSSLALAMLSLYFTLFSASNTRLYCVFHLQFRFSPLMIIHPTMHASFSGRHLSFFHTGFKINWLMLIPMQCSAWRILALLPGAMQIKQQCNIPIHPSIQRISFAFSLQFCKHCTAPPNAIRLCFRESNAMQEPMYRYINLIWACMSAYFTDPKDKRREM